MPAASIEGHEDHLLTASTIIARGLGAAEIARTGNATEATELRSGKAVALVLYLASMPRRTADREQLVDLLWSDVDPESGRHALRQTVWYLRKRLGTDVVTSDTSSITVAARVVFDRDAFVGRVEAGDCPGAVALYEGEFLPGLAVPGGAEFERWAELERARLRTMFVRCAERVTRDHLASGKNKDAQAMARRIQAADPWNQVGWRLLIEALASARDMLGAALEADRIDQLLQREEMEAEPATRAALRLARQPAGRSGGASEVAAPPRSLVTDLIGREVEFRRLLEVWEAARAGTAVGVTIVAPAGIGKTRLLQDFQARLRAMRSRLVFTRARMADRGTDFALLADVVAALADLPGAAGLSPGAAASLVAVNPALSSQYSVAADTSVGEEALRRRAFALAELIRAVSDEAPLALLIDDEHWADRASLQAFSLAFARVTELPVLGVTTSRPGGGLRLDVPAIERIDLHPLNVAQVQEFVEHLARLPEEPWTQSLPLALHRATDGSPLMLLETLMLAHDQETLRIADGAWRCDKPEELSSLVRDGSALERRLEALSPSMRRVLGLLSVAGLPLPMSALESAGAAVSEALTALEERGLVRHTHDEFATAHDAIAEAMMAQLSATELTAAHHAIAESLAPMVEGRPLMRGAFVRHAVLGAAWGVLQAGFQRELERSRRNGNRRDTATIAAAYLAGSDSAATRAMLVRHVPWRLRRRARVVRAAGIAAVVLALGAFALPVLRPHEEASFYLRGTVDGAPVWKAVSARDLRADAQIDVAVDSPALSPEVPPTERVQRTISLGDGRYVLSRLSNDSGGSDVYLWSRGRGLTRLTDSKADDGVDDASPDGTKLLITSGRWAEREHRNIGILDLQTGALTRIAPSNDGVFAPRWSPDGTRIAYARHYFTPKAPEICVIDVDGTDERCRAFAGVRGVSVLAWRSSRSLLVNGVQETGMRLDLLDTETWSLEHIADAAMFGVASRDGEYVVARSGVASAATEPWVVIPVQHPADRATISVHGQSPRTAAFEIVDAASTLRRPYLESVRINSGSRTIAVDLSERLSVEGRSSTGTVIGVEAVRWTSLDTMTATVSADGIVTPRAKGAVRIVASAGGWRADTVTLTVANRQAALVLTEDWSTMRPERWHPFGEPRPSLGRADGVGALFVNGDNNFTSGVHEAIRRTVSAGLAVHATLRLPLTESQWQAITLTVNDADSTMLERWNHSDGAEPGPASGICSVNLPAGEGYPAASRAAAMVAVSEEIEVDAKTMLSGRWVPVDMQIFPDGRCGVAIDGRPIGISRRTFEPKSSVVIHLSGMSWRTKAAVGPVEVWTGIRPGIDWQSVGRRR